MSQGIISEETKNNLARLDKAGILKKFYLAGGTALALQLKHRLSLDLDFFTSTNLDIKLLIQKLKNLGGFSIEKESEDTLIGEFRGTRIAFFRYDYPLLFPLKDFEGIKIADVRDIGCMKIAAISSRGTKKDFIDLFFICQEIMSLKEFLRLFMRKYKAVNYNMVHIFKSLIYFKDAELDPMPKMIAPVSWVRVKEFFREEIKNICDSFK